MFVRAALGACLGALTSVVAAVVSYQFNATVRFEMDHDPAAMVAGLYGVERVGEETYAWSRQDVRLTLPGIDRSRPWTCTALIKGGREDVRRLPEVTFTVDGVVRARRATSNDYQSMQVDLPAQSANGALVGMHVSETFRPAGGDDRDLGVLVDRWTCAPAAGGIVWLPARVTRAAAVSGGAFGAAFVMLGATWVVLVAAVVSLGVGQAVPLTLMPGAFSPDLERGAWLGVAAAALLVGCAVVWRLRRVEWSAPARFVLAWTAAVVVLKLLVLLHPGKAIVDAVFHAHRVQWVIDGRYFFTQPMPSGVAFPYAIGLYVFAWPFTWLTDDFVTLLRVIVVAAEATGGILLFALVARWWRDPLAGALAAVLFSVVPLPFVIIGNANMTNVFAQALAVASVAAAIGWRLHPRQIGTVIGFTLITAAALLSHISTLTLLAVMLGLMVVAYWWRGDAEVRVSGGVVLGASAVAGIIAVLVYYRHFVDAFTSALSVRASGGAAAGTAAGVSDAVGLMDRVAEAGQLVVVGLGWPLLALGAVGTVAFWRRDWRDRLDLGVLALLATAVVCIGVTVATPVDRPFLRYAAEFISRVIFTTAPAMVVLAGLGGATLWRRGGVWRAAAALAVAAALIVGIDQWVHWII